MKIDNFLIFAKNIDCGYMLELLQRGGTKEYPQSMFWSKSKKNTVNSEIFARLLFREFSISEILASS